MAFIMCPNTKYSWIAGPLPGSTAYLLQESANSCSLLDPTGVTAEPVALDLPGTFCSLLFMADGNLHHVHQEDSPSQHLIWSEIDPSTGQSTNAIREYTWTGSMDGIYHAGAQQVLGMVNSHTIAIMSMKPDSQKPQAATLTERARCVIEPVSTTAQPKQLQHVQQALSFDASILAVSFTLSAAAIHDENHDPNGRTAAPALSVQQDQQIHEVHLFEVRTGRCIQTVCITASLVSLHWSPNQNLLAIYSSGEPTDPPFAQSWACNSTRCSRIRIIDPARQTVVDMHSQLQAIIQKRRGIPSFKGCSWSPCGQLLVAEYDRTAYPGNICFLFVDPVCAQHIHDTGDLLYSNEVWWGSGNDRAAGSSTVIAWLADAQAVVRMSRNADGSWQNAGHLRNYLQGELSDGVMAVRWRALAADGKSAVLLGRDASSSSGTHDAYEYATSPDDTPRLYLYHQNLDTLDRTRVTGCPALHDSTQPEIKWAPAPADWPKVYAFLHQPAEESPNLDPEIDEEISVVLVDAAQHTMLGRWTSAMLLQFAENQGLQPAALDTVPKDIVWCPNGRHLLVVCGNCSFVLTF